MAGWYIAGFIGAIIHCMTMFGFMKCAIARPILLKSVIPRIQVSHITGSVAHLVITWIVRGSLTTAINLANAAGSAMVAAITSMSVKAFSWGRIASNPASSAPLH